MLEGLNEIEAVSQFEGFYMLTSQSKQRSMGTSNSTPSMS
jgi:hypothetical protein